MRKGFLISSIAVLGLLLSSVYINISSSLPFTIFLSKYSEAPISRGSYCVLEHPKVSYRLVKCLVGLPGDSVEVSGRKVFINGKFIAEALTESPRSGKKYDVIYPTKIPEGYYFSYASHDESFDSRYEEFGLVQKKWIKRSVWPVY